jgi:hypothetical protein
MSRGIDPDVLRDLGHQAAEAYLEKNASLNETIAAMASEHGLNAHHVQRVVEAANGAVHGALYKGAAATGRDRNIAFEIARPEEIAAIVTGGLPKVAMDLSSRVYDTPPDTSWRQPAYAKRTVVMPAMAKIASPARKDGRAWPGSDAAELAAQSAYRVRETSRYEAKLASVHRGVRGNAVAAEIARDAAMETLTKEAYRLVQRGLPFEKVAAGVTSARPDYPETIEVMVKIGECLASSGRIPGFDVDKLASMLVDPEFLSDQLSGVRVNQGSTVIQALDTLVNASREAEHQYDSLSKMGPSRGIGVKVQQAS